jgi:hypothetical protein
VLRPATPRDGVQQLADTEIEELIELYDKKFDPDETVFFIPASGAASRMFKDILGLLALSSEERVESEIFRKLEESRNSLPFEIPTDLDALKLPEYLIEVKEYHIFPKGLLPFHRYTDETLCAAEEHLSNLANLRENIKVNRPMNAHFTVAPSFLNRFKMVAKQEGFFDIIDTTYSFQHAETDTPAATPEGEPFIANGEWLFRPGGHGALLRNLDELEHPLVVIRNIDNIPRRENQSELNHWRKVLIGYLKQTVQKIQHAAEFIKEEKGTKAKAEITELFSLTDTASWSDSDWIDFLNRPIRVCGMVKNEGEPGGGPFWARNCFGETSLQIVEKAQLDLSNDEVIAQLNRATHFNPVDLACWTHDLDGKPFNLQEFVDEEAYFIADKSHDGRSLKALELPGLWNGSMSGWHTFFIEVPLETFNPVKTLFDLLKPAHNDKR